MKHIILAALLLGAWGGIKIPFESRMAAEQDILSKGALRPLDFKARDDLGQGMMLAAMGGFRSLVASFIWIDLRNSWEKQEWSRVQTAAELAVLLQPRSVFYWDNGSWMLGWNASIGVENYGSKLATPQERQEESRKWIDAAIRMLERGIRAIPEKPTLYMRLGDLYWQRLKDYRKAAEYYDMARKLPGAPTFAERFVGYGLEKAGDDRAAYDYWKELWKSGTDHATNRLRWEKVGERIRELENKLNVPDNARLFPKGAGAATAPAPDGKKAKSL
jgi:tetratricopeptide (TPR) repeat protein